MSDEIKPKERTFDFPMMPIFGVDLGERLGSMDARLIHVEKDIQALDTKIDVVEAKLTDKIEKLDAKIDAVEAKLTDKIEKLNDKIDGVDSRVDGCLVAINRLDERTKNLQSQVWVVGGGILVAVLAGIVLQLLSR